MPLRDVPVDAVGISWNEWMDQQRERIFAEARQQTNTLMSPAALEVQDSQTGLHHTIGVCRSLFQSNDCYRE